MNHKISIYLILTTFFLSGCVTVDTVKFEVLRPQKDTNINLPDQFSLKNTYLSDNQMLKDDFKNLVAYDKYRLDSLVSVESLRAVYEIVNEANYSTITAFDSIGTNSINSDVVIELKNVDITSEVETEPVYVNNKNAYYAAIMVPYRLEWNILENNKLLQQKIYHDTVWAEGYKKSFDKLADLVHFDDVIKYIINKTAIDYARTISPTWQKVKRYFIRSGNNDLQRAGYFFDNTQYDKAAEIWKKYIHASNKTIVGYSYLNLAVYYELKGEINKAIEMAKIAQNKKNNLASQYLNILEQRKKEISLLLKNK